LETVLNLVWISVSLGLLLICGSHVLRGGADRRRAIAAVALLCLVCLLFPVISATDDVNAAGPALVETNKFKRFAASAPAALALLPWLLVQMTPEQNRWSAVNRPAAFPPPPADAFFFPLNRRPPPSQSPTS
jgi:hypothetical protein